MGVGQAMEIMGIVLQHAMVAPKPEVEPARIPRLHMVALTVLDLPHSTRPVIRILVVSCYFYKNAYSWILIDFGQIVSWKIWFSSIIYSPGWMGKEGLDSLCSGRLWLVHPCWGSNLCLYKRFRLCCNIWWLLRQSGLLVVSVRLHRKIIIIRFLPLHKTRYNQNYKNEYTAILLV